MDPNAVTQEAGNRIRGAKLRESFVASPLTRAACENLQRQFEEVARPGESVPDVYAHVDFMNRLAARRFAEYLETDREIRRQKSVYAWLAEQRDDAATEVAAVLAPAKRASDELQPRGRARLWLHGPVERTPASLRRQAADVAFWGHEARDQMGQPVLEGLRLDVDALVAEINKRNGKLGRVLDSLDDVALHLEATRNRAREAGEACDQTYLQVKATLEAVCHLAGEAKAVRKYGPPSLRKLQRSKKRKKRSVMAEEVVEDALTVSDSQAASPAVSVQESDLQDETRSTGVRQSDPQLEEGSTIVQQSDLQIGTCSTAACKDSSALPDGVRRRRRRQVAVTAGGGGPGGRLSAVTDGFRGPCRRRLSVTRSVCTPRRSRSEVTDGARSPETRGRDLREGVTARIRRFFSRPLGT